MKTDPRIIGLAVLLLLVSSPVTAQLHVEIEASGGYTLADIEAIAELDGARATDWENPSYRIGARALFGPASGTRFGGEVAYQHLYWYQARIPFGLNPIRREYDVSGTSVLGVVRFGSAQTMLDVGAGVAIVDGAVPAVTFGVGWIVFPSVAVRLRADGVFDGEPVVPVGFAVSYSIGAGS